MKLKGARDFTSRYQYNMKFIGRSVDTAWLRYVQPTAADNWQVTYELGQSDSASYNALNSIPLGSKSGK